MATSSDFSSQSNFERSALGFFVSSSVTTDNMRKRIKVNNKNAQTDKKSCLRG